MATQTDSQIILLVKGLYSCRDFCCIWFSKVWGERFGLMTIPRAGWISTNFETRDHGASCSRSSHLKMQTSLPDLPFTNYGKAELRPSRVPTHSSSKSTPRTYPRTDLEMLTPWTSFPNDIHRVIQSATTRAGLPPTPLHLEGYTGTTFVTNEEAIRAHAMFALHTMVQNLMQRFGIDGYFEMPSSGYTRRWSPENSETPCTLEGHVSKCLESWPLYGVLCPYIEISHQINQRL